MRKGTKSESISWDLTYRNYYNNSYSPGVMAVNSQRYALGPGHVHTTCPCEEGTLKQKGGDKHTNITIKLLTILIHQVVGQ